MKTPRIQRTGLDVTRADTARLARGKRTLAVIACESLEGKKLMTGFAGAAMAGGMPGGPAEMGDTGGYQLRRDDAGQPGGGQGRDVAASGGSDAAGQVAASAVDSGRAAVPAQGGTQGGGMQSFLRRGDARGLDGSFGGDHHDLVGGTGDGFDRGTGGGSASDVPSTGNTQLDADLKKFRTDEQAIHGKSQVTPALRAAVRQDMEAIDAAKTGTADATALQTLQADQKTILVGGTRPTDAQQAQLQGDQDAVLLSQGVSQSLIDQLAADRLAAKTASNFTADDQATLDADQAAIRADRTAATTTDPTTTITATPTLAAGHYGGMGFGHHAGQGSQSGIQDAGVVGGQVRRASRR